MINLIDLTKNIVMGDYYEEHEIDADDEQEEISKITGLLAEQMVSNFVNASLLQQFTALILADNLSKVNFKGKFKNGEVIEDISVSDTILYSQLYFDGLEFSISAYECSDDLSPHFWVDNKFDGEEMFEIPIYDASIRNSGQLRKASQLLNICGVIRTRHGWLEDTNTSLVNYCTPYLNMNKLYDLLYYEWNTCHKYIIPDWFDFIPENYSKLSKTEIMHIIDKMIKLEQSENNYNQDRSISNLYTGLQIQKLQKDSKEACLKNNARIYRSKIFLSEGNFKGMDNYNPPEFDY